MVNTPGSNPTPEIIVTWLPSTDNCRETGYVIGVQLIEIDHCKPTQKSPQSHYMQYIGADEPRVATFEDLLSFSTYNVTVTANNSAGFGEDVFIQQVTHMSGKRYNWLRFHIQCLKSTCHTIVCLYNVLNSHQSYIVGKRSGNGKDNFPL